MSDRTLAPLFTWRSAICESDLTPTVKHVALALSLYMNERGGSAFPGAERLARDTSLGERTVRRDLQRLVDGGWLRLVSEGGRRGGRKHANEYVATTPEKGAGDAGFLEKGCTSPRERVQDSAGKGAPGAPQLSKNSSRTPEPDRRSAVQRAADESVAGMQQARRIEHERNAQHLAAIADEPRLSDDETRAALAEARAALAAARRNGDTPSQPDS